MSLNLKRPRKRYGENMPQFREDDAITYIINQLEILEYKGLETLERSWVRSVLVTPGSPRKNLMMWVLSYLCPTEAADLPTVPEHTHTQRIMQSLSCMGICQPGDSEVIEGTAPPALQLKFWCMCLDSIWRLLQFLPLTSQQQAESNTADMLLDRLAHSPYLQPTLKEGGVSIIPGDLREKYRAWCKHGGHISYPDLLLERKDQVKSQLEKYNAMEERWKVRLSEEEHHQLQADVCQGLSGLSKQLDLFQGVYTAYIAPWTTSTKQLELPNTGPLVHESNSKLATITEIIKSMKEPSKRCEDLAEHEKSLARHTNHPSAITSTLHSILSKTTPAKPQH